MHSKVDALSSHDEGLVVSNGWDCKPKSGYFFRCRLGFASGLPFNIQVHHENGQRCCDIELKKTTCDCTVKHQI
jgi:hypothetical protein